jgi:hypothetical protein
MKILTFLMMTFMSFLAMAMADDISVEVNPPEPIMNESFYLTFKIKTSGSVDPYISFTPSGASVLGKSEQGVSISTVVINGKFTTTREQNYVYEMMAERAGQVSLKNIKVEISGKTTTLKDVYLNVLSAPRKVPDAFMEAQASKTRVYLGEGIDVNYYLYFKTSIAANDVKEFPKLNRFIKRFHHVNSPVETVQYKGQVLKRILAYSARLYPEKVGTAVLDPMTISVQIIENEYSNPFGGFGMGSQRFKNKDLSSPRIEVEVLPLPAENVPPGFTGMVGEHEFTLSMNKGKFLVNEPIELKLEVKGKGALEKMEAPVFFTDNNLEQFDTKSDMTEINNQTSKKVFDYTLLARGPLSIKSREMSLAYFDPAAGRYIEKKITIPALEVGGTAAPAASTGAATTPGKNQQSASKEGGEDDFLSRLFAPSKTKAINKNEIGLVGPVMAAPSLLSSHWLDIFNAAILVFILAFGIFWYTSSKKGVDLRPSVNASLKKEISNMKSHGLNYPDLYKVLAALDVQNRMSHGGVSIHQVIEESGLSGEAKAYFKSALLICEERSFVVVKNEKKINFESKYFNELLKNI